jgi:type IV pilus assembly protein PilE
VSRGFTLLELLACVLIAALLAGLALPSWRGLLLRAQRADASAALYAVAAAQERYRLIHGRYADAAGPAPPVGLGFDRSERGWYELRIEFADVSRFIATARAVPGSPQVADAACRVFTIDSTGVRGSTPDPPEKCWR